MGAKNGAFMLSSLDRCFNPRARDGREETKPLVMQLMDVSIHAPVMDAKLLRVIRTMTSMCFNPRARDGRE